MGVDRFDMRASGNSVVHFRPVSAHSLASLFFRIPFCLSTSQTVGSMGSVGSMSRMEENGESYGRD